MVRVKQAGSTSAGQLCSICQTVIVIGEVIVACPACTSPYHKECWDENQGCAQYGCTEAPDTEKHDVADVGGAWGDEKKCPACGRMIKSKALKCRHCKASFESRSAISSEAYKNRPYDLKELSKRRNLIIVLFFVSATGVFSWLGALLLGILAFNGSLGSWLQFKRLTPELQIFIYCGFGLGSILTCALILATAMGGA